MARNALKIIAFLAPITLVPVALVACGNGEGTTTTTGSGGTTSSTGTHTTSSTTTTTTSSSSTTSTTTTGTGGAGTGGAGTGGGSGCQDNCINNNPAAAQKFEAYQLKECGCAANSPCFADCAAACPDTVPAANSSCGMCLLAQANLGMGSPCTVTAAETDCLPDAACSPFIVCELGCP